MSDETRTAPAGASPMTRVVVRILLLVLLVVAGSNEVTRPHASSLDELQADLATGDVSAMTIERPADQAEGTFAVRWDAGPFDSYARYEYSWREDVDEAAGLVERAHADGVAVTIISPSAGFIDNDGWLANLMGGWSTLPALFAGAGILIVLATGPQPWFATRWAWFWLGAAIPVLWLAFLLFEPRPLWHSARLASAEREPVPNPEDQDRRLTGGWAFLIAGVVASVLATVPFPWLNGWHPFLPTP
ncbi:hypothetical protein IM660_14415 [Ruania alkalisoli]|uniref:Uncharacterized protein n=1 Tax=Ruania alkalisoli TaxID=2779775 RepID=A0A7M1SQJ1_9MICO|nr:hypothetical protein [Ruania alkalisoli]QOR69839.1 hypothetical protein IM660_14415 [Ruania alkalisoli]